MLLFRSRVVVFWLLVVAAVSRADSLPSSAWLPVAPGLDYQHFVDSNRPWSIHIARLERSRPGWDIVSTHARNQIAALGTVVSQVAGLPAVAGKPLVAINGDFFVIAKGPYQGDPLGLQILAGNLISAPTGPSFWIEPGGKFRLGKVTSGLSVTWPRGGNFRFGLNEDTRTNGLTLFTPAFGSSTRTTNGIEFVLEKTDGTDWLPLHAGHTYATRVREVRTSVNAPLTHNTAVLSVAPGLAAQFSGIHTGAELQISTATTPDLGGAETAIGGKPILISHGKLEHFAEGKGTNVPVRAPRTAIGWNERYFYFMVVDGRQKGLSMGMTYAETAAFMKQLDCTEALNLDGGGSTTFWLNGKVMNSPSDKHERTVANALVIVEHEVASAAGSAPPK